MYFIKPEDGTCFDISKLLIYIKNNLLPFTKNMSNLFDLILQMASIRSTKVFVLMKVCLEKKSPVTYVFIPIGTGHSSISAALQHI